MKKLKLLLAFCALLIGWSNASADVSLNAFSNVKEAWGGSGGVTKDVYLVERYYGSRPTGLIMAQAVSSIPNGTYDVVVIAHACHANSVGGDFVASNNTLSVNGSSQTVATIDNSAVDKLPLTEYTFSNVSVTDGTMNIKFNADAAGANWFTIRVKSVTLKGDYEDKTSLLTNADFSAQKANNLAITGWTKATTFVSHVNGDGFTGTFAEIWRANDKSIEAGELSQTVNLPAGVYALSANIRSRRVTSHLFATIGGKEQKHTHIGDDGIGVRSLTFVVNQTSDVTIGFKNDANSTTGADKWVAVDDIKITRLGDVGETSLTSQIDNPSFESGDLSLWTNSDMEVQTNMSFAGIQGHIYAQRWHSAGEKSVKQTLSGIPSGRYRLTVNAQDGGGTGVKIYAGDKETAVTSLNDYNVDFISNGSNVEIGYVATGTSSSWLAVDNFRLQYYGPCAASEAVALPDGGAMEADKWYYFDIDAAADNYNATATTLGDIICTDDGNTSASAVTGNVTLTETDNSFAAKRYYVKSSTANNLEISVASYTYSISEASANVSCIQEGNTVTVSYTVGTNDTSATLKQDYSGVRFNGAAIPEITPTASGFTFTVPEVTVGTEYTLAIPAGAIGYDAGSTYNEAQNITLNAPAVFDGIYFLKAAATYDGTSEGTSAAVGKYLARGLNYGTRATLDKYGLPVQITTNGNNETTIKAYDTNRYFFHANTYDCYADQGALAATSYFTVTLNNGKLLIHNNSMAAGTYLKYNTDAAGDANIAVFDDGTGNNAGPIIMWTTEDASAHATAMQSYKDAQAATAAAAAYASGKYASLSGITTVSALEAELEANYIKGDFVSPSAIESVLEKYQGDQPGSDNITETVYSNSINITEPGFYKFSMQAFYRAASNDVTQNMHTNSVDFPPVTLFFGNSETQIKSVYDEGNAAQIVEGWGDVTYDGQHYPNNTDASLKMFKADKYHNDVYFYVSEPGEYTYGVKYMGWACANAQWFIYSPESVEITSYAAAADAADYTALKNAIDAYDGATWGFETGEYAPYNNLEAINNIAAAKAIDKDAENSKLLVNSLTTKLALTANDVEVNAFYKGDFDGYAEDASSPLDYTPNGWTATDNFRVMIKNVEDYPGLADASAGTAAMSWSGGITYGETAGYTMPLKANTVYRLQFKAAGWNNETRSGMSVSILNSTDGMALYNLGTPDRDIKGNATNTAGMTSYDVVFATGAAGNYVFKIKSGNNMVVTDFFITKAASQVLEFVDNSAVPAYAPGTYPSVKITRTLTANRWATAVYPFAVSGVDNIAVLDSYNSSTGELGFTSAAASTANVPFLMRSTAGTTEITLSNVEVAAASATPATASEASLKGAYTATEITNAEKNYVLSNNQIFSVGEKGATINPYRAYIQIAEDVATPARALRFVVDGQITGVDNVAAEASAEVKDGKYLENGKIVVVKNGKKFNAAGAQMK